MNFMEVIMLKIKDNYDLRQLMDYGFYRTCGDTWVYRMSGEDQLSIVINPRGSKVNGEVTINSCVCKDEIDDYLVDTLGDPTVLYRMIMDGIVEVVE
jgi:hypothetical protein